MAMDLLGNIPDKSLHSTNTQKRSWLTFKETALSTDMPGMIEAPDLVCPWADNIHRSVPTLQEGQANVR
ncbi:hypothetical protein Y1Q_0011318 [Alligator mississippiensis]|uniref:Uncharacterized protein n=1 Tax=Alligator mississippiensis TaxID=8496 RepID=A0A151N860_ALLMI|nr:hypothetical protein Y1Q_0011318 [Alligator mississippiensis]